MTLHYVSAIPGKTGSLARLYARNRRDAILIHALAHKTPLQEVNDTLFQAEEETLC